MKWNLVPDSSCDMLSTDLDENIHLDVVPLTIVVGDKYFRDDENIDTKELLAAMKAEKRASSTACPSPRDFFEYFSKADCSIGFTLTGSLSGTYNAACLGRDMVREEFPEKKIHVVDTGATAGKLVLLIRKATELIKQGLEFEDVVQQLERYNKDTDLIFALGGYDNMIKTGRMSRLAGVLATNLGIRAVARAVNGEVEVVKKPRGERAAIEAMIAFMEAKKPMKGRPIIITHCNNPVGAMTAKLMMSEHFGTDPELITIMDCRGLTTFYTMQNGLIVAY